MRETIDIPRDKLFEFKRQNGLTASKMALYFGVGRPTMEGWLYKRAAYKMSRVSYDMLMEKLAKGNIPAESAWQPSKDIALPLIATAISGDAETCWLHYVSEVYPHNRTEEKRILIRYTCVQETTLRRWLSLIMPGGQNLLRLRCFLGHRGYGVVELEKLGGLLKLFTYLIADQKITMEEAFGKLDYKQAGSLIQVLLGNVGMGDDRLDMCRNLIAEHAVVKIEQEEGLVYGNGVEIKPVEDAPVLVQFNRQEVKSPIRRVNGTCRWEVESLAALVRGMLPLAEHVLSDECTEQDRERLRTLANEDGVFRLSNALNGLCGPRMRMRVMNKQERE